MIEKIWVAYGIRTVGPKTILAPTNTTTKH